MEHGETRRSGDGRLMQIINVGATAAKIEQNRE
jgi:hypothetical protein